MPSHSTGTSRPPGSRLSAKEPVARDKASLDVFWLRDESLEDADSLPPPHVIAAEIVEDLEAALTQFAEIAESLVQAGPQLSAANDCPQVTMAPYLSFGAEARWLGHRQTFPALKLSCADSAPPQRAQKRGPSPLGRRCGPRRFVFCIALSSVLGQLG